MPCWKFAIVIPLALGLPGCGSSTSKERPKETLLPVMSKASQAAMTPTEALERLKGGNDRFVNGRSLNRDLPAEVRGTAAGQYPFAAILSCVDSRVSPELVFDQGLGDIFCARVAGNVVDDDILASLEFATQVAGAKLVVVVGHSSCGAVKGACHNLELGHLTGLLKKIEPAVKAAMTKADGSREDKNAAFVDDVAKENVRQMVRLLSQESPLLRDLVSKGALKIVGAFQELGSGRVVFLE